MRRLQLWQGVIQALSLLIISSELGLMPDQVTVVQAQSGSNLLRDRENSSGEHGWDEFASEFGPKKKKFPGYNQYGGEFRKWCDGMREDGRGDEVWYFALSMSNEDDAECPACKPFFKTLSASCKEKKKRAVPRKAGEPEVTPTPLLRQREPHIKVIRIVAETFADLAEEGRAADTYLAVKKLAQFLENAEGKRKGAAEYYAIVAPHLFAAFRNHEKQSNAAPPEAAIGKRIEDKKQALDSLFTQ